MCEEYLRMSGLGVLVRGELWCGLGVSQVKERVWFRCECCGEACVL